MRRLARRRPRMDHSPAATASPPTHPATAPTTTSHHPPTTATEPPPPAAHHRRTAPPLATATPDPEMNPHRSEAPDCRSARQVGHDDGVTSLVGEALRQRCIEAVVDRGRAVRHPRAGTGIRAHRRQRWPRRPGALGAGVARPRPGRSPRHRAPVGHGHRPGRHHRTAAARGQQTPPADGLLDWYATGLSSWSRTLRTTPPDAPGLAHEPGRREGRRLVGPSPGARARRPPDGPRGRRRRPAHARSTAGARRGRRRRAADASSSRAGRTPNP